ncbi:hypothetical protein GCM10028895_01110 [Pontibacter rugosus]
MLVWVLYACEGSDARQQQHAQQQVEVLPVERKPYVRASSLIDAMEDSSSYWVDSVFSTLTPDERIAQLIIIEAFSDQGATYEADVMYLVKKYKIGG